MNSDPHSIIKQYRFDRMEMAENELIRLYGDRYKKYREQFIQAGDMAYEPDFPVYIMLEQTYRCNLRCISCIHGYPSKRKKYDMGMGTMPWELFEKIVLEGERHSCPSISVHNNDEPLLVKDLEKRISFARDHGFMDVIMTTNAVLFTEDKIKRVIDAGVTRILFSIDALTEDTYNKVRPGGNLKKVLDSLDFALNYRESQGFALPIIRVSFVPNSENQHEMKAFFEKYASIVDYIDIQPFCTYYDLNAKIIPEGTVPLEDYRCNCPWRYSIIRANGDVLPCPNFYGTELVMGNINKNSLYDIFNSERFKTLRQDFKKGIYHHSVCQECAKGIYSLQLNQGV